MSSSSSCHTRFVVLVLVGSHDHVDRGSFSDVRWTRCCILRYLQRLRGAQLCNLFCFLILHCEIGIFSVSASFWYCTVHHITSHYVTFYIAFRVVGFGVPITERRPQFRNGWLAISLQVIAWWERMVSLEAPRAASIRPTLCANAHIRGCAEELQLEQGLSSIAFLPLLDVCIGVFSKIV